MSSPAISHAPGNGVSTSQFRAIDVPNHVAPRLCVIVDTEEEFDWSAPFDRSAVGVTAIDEVWRLQDVLKIFGAIPMYVIDFPVNATQSSATRLGELAALGECEIGAHLHPWVNPPHDEPVEARLSFPCNLPPALEFEKIRVLKDTISERLGIVPTVYKAGRYGFGRSTAYTLETLEFRMDVSVNPHMDYSRLGGPSFLGFSARPASFGREKPLIELPCTTGFVGRIRREGERVHAMASRPLASRVRAVGLLARLGLLNRIMLSPEGSTLDEMKALTRALIADGVRTFSLTFHSPSLKPGCTPYVRTSDQRDRFLGTLGDYVDFFTRELNGITTTPHELANHLSKGFPA